MKLTHALVGLVALGGAALTTGAASAMPIAPAASTDQIANVEQARYVCNGWGHCWSRPNYYGGGYGYYGPRRFYGGGWGWHHRHYW